VVESSERQRRSIWHQAAQASAIWHQAAQASAQDRHQLTKPILGRREHKVAIGRHLDGPFNDRWRLRDTQYAQLRVLARADDVPQQQGAPNRAEGRVVSRLIAVVGAAERCRRGRHDRAVDRAVVAGNRGVGRPVVGRGDHGGRGDDDVCVRCRLQVGAHVGDRVLEHGGARPPVLRLEHKEAGLVPAQHGARRWRLDGHHLQLRVGVGGGVVDEQQLGCHGAEGLVVSALVGVVDGHRRQGRCDDERHSGSDGGRVHVVGHFVNKGDGTEEAPGGWCELFGKVASGVWTRGD